MPAVLLNGSERVVELESSEHGLDHVLESVSVSCVRRLLSTADVFSILSTLWVLGVPCSNDFCLSVLGLRVGGTLFLLLVRLNKCAINIPLGFN